MHVNILLPYSFFATKSVGLETTPTQFWDPNFQNLIYLLPGLWLAQLKNGQTFPFLSFFPHIHQVLVLIFQVSINYRPWFFIGRALEAVVKQPQNGSSPSIPSCLPFNTSRLD
jgi:hypothetical protein